jgi:hypothetical protein
VISTQGWLTVYDLEKDPDEKDPLKVLGAAADGGPDPAKEMAARLRDFERTMKEKPAYGCLEDCLNGAYRRKGKDADASVK